GLDRLRQGKFTSYTTQNGLFDDVVFRILDDDAGNLWMSSNRGVYRVARDQLEAFAEGRAPAIVSVAYGRTDSMKSSESNGAHQPAGWKTRDGKLWFPTIRGVVSVDPKNIRLNSLAPPVMIERFQTDGKDVGVHEAQLPPGQRNVEFGFTALSLLAPENVRFK